MDSTDYTLPRVKLAHAPIPSISVDIIGAGAKARKDTAGARSAHDCVAQARNVFAIDRTRSLKFRKHQLRQLRRMFEENETAMIDALKLDLGKAQQEAVVFEIEFVKNDLLNILYNFDEWVRPESRYKRFMNFFDTLQLYKDPYGVVLIIGAWNFPVRSALSPIAGAIAGGNCVIVHPHHDAAHTAAFIAETLPKYLDNDCYQVSCGDRYHTEALLKERFDYIFYTGQTHGAQQVHRAAAQHLTPTTMIMGGKNPVYIDDSCHMEMTVRRVLWGKCMNAGQTCAGVEYILCTSEVQDKFVKVAPKILEEFYGTNIESSQDYGRLISNKHFERSAELLKGKTIALGGHTNAATRFMQPTIVTNVSPNDVIMLEDILAPILPIVTIRSLDEAIAFINAREKPLAMYIFSRKGKDVEKLLSHTSAGTVCVNDTLMQLAAESLPFGGVGASGMGAYHGKASFDTFVHEKSVLKKGFSRLVEMIECVRYPPNSSFKTFYLKSAMVRRRRMSIAWVPYVICFIVGFALFFLVSQF